MARRRLRRAAAGGGAWGGGALRRGGLGGRAGGGAGRRAFGGERRRWRRRWDAGRPAPSGAREATVVGPRRGGAVERSGTPPAAAVVIGRPDRGGSPAAVHGRGRGRRHGSACPRIAGRNAPVIAHQDNLRPSDRRIAHPSQSRCRASSAYPTNATESMMPWATISGHSRPVRRHTWPNTRPIATFPRPAPKPWYR